MLTGSPFVLRCYKCSLSIFEISLFVTGFIELTGKVEEQLGNRHKPTKYSSRNYLHKRMLGLNPLFPDFVSGSKCGSGKYFFCRVCCRDVSIKARGSREIERHFRSDGHWYRDFTYRVHKGLPVFNRLMEPMTLTDD